MSLNILHYKAIRKLKGLIFNFKLELIKIEIFDLHKQIYFLSKELSFLSRSLHRLLPSFVWDSITKHHSYSFNNFKHRLFVSHYNKFMGLLTKMENESIKNSTSINYTYQGAKKKYCIDKFSSPISILPNPNDIKISINPHEFNNKSNVSLDHTNNKWFLNLSNSVIPKEVSTLLQFGERFSLPTHLNKKRAIHEFIKDIESNMALHKSNKQILIRNIAIPQLHKYIKSTPSVNPSDYRLIHLLNVTKHFCHNNRNIIFTRADKGNITVAMDEIFYFNKVEELLSDVSTYTVVKRNPIKSIENNLNNVLKKWLQNDYISKQQYFKLRSSDSILPKAYGLPKVHKKNTPFRIIVSSMNTALYSLASFLQDIISDSLKKTNSHIANSFELYNSLSGKIVQDSDILISLDVTSLFTNVPLDLAMDSISERWSYIQRNTKISKNEFLIAIKFVLSSTYFTFNNIIYKQTYGTPMGSPLSPVIADIVMQDLETSCLNRINCKLTFYFRYVDDIVMAAPSEKTDLIFKTFNEYHDRIKFTIEYEESRSISFLDLLLTISDNVIQIDWFHKKSFSGRFLSFHSSHPLCHKIGMIYGLVDRAFLLSHPSFHKKNIRYVIELLIENSYPLNFIFEKINNRLKTLIYNKKSNAINNNEKNMNSLDDNNKKIIVFPYIKKISELIAATIDKSQYITGYRILNNLGKFIKAHKDTNKILTNNNVVYKIQCNDCNASYVGQTKRQLKTRIKEHRNNIKLPSKPSVITEHTIEYSHSFDWDNAKILDTESNYFKRSVSEMLHIKEQINGINAQKDTELLDSSYFNLLDMLSRF